MDSASNLLPGTGRGTGWRSQTVEGSTGASGPTTTAFGGGPPPRSGEEQE
jgi:hypothetical protein